MSVSLFDLQNARRTVTVKYMDMAFDIVYNPNWLTPENEDDLKNTLQGKIDAAKLKAKQVHENPEATSDDEVPEVNVMRDSLIHTLTHALLDWDIFIDKEKTKKLPINEEGIRKLGYPLQTAILRTINRDSVADVGEA